LSDRIPETQRDLLHGLARLKLPMPRTTRELFELFALYHPSEGLAGLLDRVDFTEVKPLQIYQVAQAMLTQRNGGWPLTMFLTPAQLPFFGGTYFPNTPRYGMPGFGDLLQRVRQSLRN
jgi:hypothetical protein